MYHAGSFSVTAGLPETARLAGRYVAIAHTASSPSPTVTKVHGSRAFTSKSTDSRMLDAAIALPMPAATPIPAAIRPCRTTRPIERAAIGADGRANRQLASSRRGRRGRDAVDTDRRDQQGHRRRNQQQSTQGAPIGGRVADQLIERAHALERPVGIDRVNGRRQARHDRSRIAGRADEEARERPRALRVRARTFAALRSRPCRTDARRTRSPTISGAGAGGPVGRPL